MQGPRSRLDQIYPARKTKTCTAGGMPPETITEKSGTILQEKATRDNFVVRRDTMENQITDTRYKQLGMIENVRESGNIKPGHALRRNEDTYITEDWLHRCGSVVSKFVPIHFEDPVAKDNDPHQVISRKSVQRPDSSGVCSNGLDGDLPNNMESNVFQIKNATGEAQAENNEIGADAYLEDEILSECVSDFEMDRAFPPFKPMGVCEASTKQRVNPAIDICGGSRKQGPEENLDDDIIACTPFPIVMESTSSVTNNPVQRDSSVSQERVMDVQNHPRERNIRTGGFRMPSDNGAEIEHGRTRNVDGTEKEMHGPDCKEIIYITDTEVSPVRSSRRALQSGNSADIIGPKRKSLSSGSIAANGVPQTVLHEDIVPLSPGCNSPYNRKPQKVGGVGHGVSQTVLHEDIVPLSPGCNSPYNRKPQKVEGVGHKTLKSKSLNIGDEGELCSTPSVCLSTPEGRSLNSVKSGDWQDNCSMYSPGDAFWNEAIEAVDGILVPTSEELLLRPCRLGKQKSSCAAPNKAPDGIIQNFENQVNKNPGTEETMKGVQDLQFCFPEDIREGDSAGVLVLDSNGSTKADNGDKFSAVDISLLPVRCFDFTSENSFLEKSIGELGNRDISHHLIEKLLDSSLEKPSEMENHKVHMEVDDVVPEKHKVCKPMEVVEHSKGDMSGISSPFEINTDVPISTSENRETVSKCLYNINKSSLPNDALTLAEREMEVGSTVTSSAKHYSLELSMWLPPEICVMYGKKGVTKLYPWQVDCLQVGGVLDGRSLVYCASTSAGKSLVAEVLMLRRILSSGKKALLVLPYVTLCSEKADHLDTLLQPIGKRVRGFFGAQGGASLPQDTSVAVCTIEKANSLINRLLEEGRLPELAIIVIDELHMVGDRDRGYLLELLLTKLRYAAGGGEDLQENMSSTSIWHSGLQIVGMSATMPNVSDVASWLQAALYQTNFRPVPLEEFLKVGLTIYDKSMEIVRSIRKGADLGGKDPDHVVELCHEVVREGNSVLVFCSSRKGCETTARHIAKLLPPFLTLRKKNATGPVDGQAAVEDLRKSPAGLDPVLADTLPVGVAYHHAGLTMEERDVVEACFKSGVVRVLVATSTLAAGVNLPARRVIFRQPKIGRDFLDATRYRQMAGRAGRAGIDSKGESILICKPEEAKRMEEMIKQESKKLQSCLADDMNGMMRALLEVVAGGIVKTAVDVKRYVRCTLLNATQPFEEVVKAAQDSLRWLCHQHLLEWDATSEIYTPTPLGRAAFSSSLSPEESLVVFEDLAKAREGFVLASDLHLLYEVTPTYVDLEPDWDVFYQCFLDLSPIDQAVGNKVGVLEPFLLRMAHGAPLVQYGSGLQTRNGRITRGKTSQGVQKSRWKSPSGAQLSVDQMLRVCKRFYVALILSKLVQEVSLLEVCEMFKVPKGKVQGLQESAGRFASMVAAFCERLGWSDMECLVTKFQKRVLFGVKAEIVDLTEIPFVKAARARALFRAGLRSIQAVAEASLPELLDALFSRARQDDKGKGGKNYPQEGVARKIKNAARRIALDRAEEARAAAFSACQALGVQVPTGLALPLVRAIDSEEAEVSGFLIT